MDLRQDQNAVPRGLIWALGVPSSCELQYFHTTTNNQIHQYQVQEIWSVIFQQWWLYCPGKFKIMWGHHLSVIYLEQDHLVQTPVWKFHHAITSMILWNLPHPQPHLKLWMKKKLWMAVTQVTTFSQHYLYCFLVPGSTSGMCMYSQWLIGYLNGPPIMYMYLHGTPNMYMYLHGPPS